MTEIADPNEKGRSRQDRCVIRAEDISDEDLALIEAAEVPAEFAYLDAEPGETDRAADS